MTNRATAFAAPLTTALPDLIAWTSYFQMAPIPVLAQTSESIELLRSNIDKVDANRLGEMISEDPLMTLKVLIVSAAQRSARSTTEVETVIGALVMMGIPPFFAAFGLQQTIDECLANNPQALAGLRETLRRAHRSANFALAVAVHRMDPDAAIIHAAALLHDFAEMLLWCHAPSLALTMSQAPRDDANKRSATAQRKFLNIELAELQQSLFKVWQLPARLTRISDASNAQQPSARTVDLAVRLARHTAHGWTDPAICVDIAEMATLLNLSEAATLLLLEDI